MKFFCCLWAIRWGLALSFIVISLTPGCSSSSTLNDAGNLDLYCHDAEACAHYQTCSQATDQDSCLKAGGSWQEVPGSNVEACFCETGQEDQECTNANQCLSECIADPINGVENCTGVAKGKCAATNIVMGCHCYFDEEGIVSAKCVG